MDGLLDGVVRLDLVPLGHDEVAKAAGQGAPVRVESNQVVVKAVEPKQGTEAAVCAVKPKTLVLKGAGGPKRHAFTVEVSSTDLKQVTFYLDGKKVKAKDLASAVGANGTAPPATAPVPGSGGSSAA